MGFEVETVSIDQQEYRFDSDVCTFPDNPKPQKVDKTGHTSLFFTYSVVWKESQVKWASRWDYLLGMNDVQIHWFSIINSLIVVFFLSGNLQINCFEVRKFNSIVSRNSNNDYGANTAS